MISDQVIALHVNLLLLLLLVVVVVAVVVVDVIIVVVDDVDIRSMLEAKKSIKLPQHHR